MAIEPKPPTVKGPEDWFTGDVWIDPIVQAASGSQLNIGAVHFSPPVPAPHGIPTMVARLSTSPRAVGSYRHTARTSSSSGPATRTTRPTVTSTGTARRTTIS